ncbi:hypothetical protein ACGFRB_31955 [Streptomyces sp. NPDC048718]|uniref:hypothetical protein n=1 Tax=Streptomyces sp. NPDC048718 TaxID=3365587 RepID=UPI00371ACE3F
MAVTALTATLVLTGSSAFAISTSTKLDNGTLYFEALDGYLVSGNHSQFFSTTKYTKTAGDSAVNIQLALSTSTAVFKTDAMSISKGQTKSKSWGGLSKATYAPDCTAAGYMIATTGKYYTPTVRFC